MERLVVKISGQIAGEPEQVGQLARYLAGQVEQGSRPVMVHGGGVQTDRLCEQLGVQIQRTAGRRITDEPALQVFRYTVAGDINTRLVEGLRSSGLRAVGLSGLDGDMTTAVRREPLHIDGHPVDFGMVGEIRQVDPELPDLLCSRKYVPVIGCLTWSREHGALNINADTMAMELAVALQAAELVMLMGPASVMDREGRPVTTIDQQRWQQGEQQGWIQGGMQPKLKNGFDALNRGVRQVRLTSTEGLLQGDGTWLQRSDAPSGSTNPKNREENR